MSLAPDIASVDSATSVEETHDTTPPHTVGKKGSLPHEKGQKKTGGTVVERPGRAVSSWERWHLSSHRDPELLSMESSLPPQSEHLVCLPSSTLFAWPLWVASEGESIDLVRLELSGRHLLKRGMEDSLVILPILRKGDRQLVLAVACEEPFPGELMPVDWKNASQFELPSRLLGGSLTHDLILWEEWGMIQMAFYRNQQPVWFSGVRSHDFAGLIHRISLRLLAEEVLEVLPASILLEGVPEKLADSCKTALTAIFPKAQITHSETNSTNSTSPHLHNDSFDIPPREARVERLRFHQRQKLFSYAIAGVILYLLLLLWAGGDLFIRQTALRRLREEIVKVEQPALEAQQQSSRWHALRTVIDPSTYALDLLAAVAAPTDGGKIRLTLFSLEQGHLHFTGEALDLTQANSAIEQLKKTPLLQEYDWISSQPQLAGKNSVKFDMEGTRPEGPRPASTP